MGYEMKFEHDTFSDRDGFMAWAANKVRQGYNISTDLYMDLLNEGYLTTRTEDNEVLPNIGFSLADTSK
jgi:hypothetical protein